MPNKNETLPDLLTSEEALAEAGSYLDPLFREFTLPDPSLIDNLYRYATWTRLARPKECDYRAPDTFVYRIVHKNHNLFILILHPRPRDRIEEEMYPNLALCVMTNSENVIVVDPATGKVRENISLKASNSQGRTIHTPLLGVDTRLTVTEVILNEQLNEKRVLQQNFPLGNEAE